MAYKCVTGIGRQSDDAAAVNDLRRLLDQPQLRVVGMDLEELGHKKETAAARGRPPLQVVGN
jgi:hypothetical protein